MRKLLLLALGIGIAVGVAAPAWAGMLAVCDTTHKSLMVFNAEDGALYNASYLSMTAQGVSNPMNAKIVSATEFWVSDYGGDQILRYDLNTNAYLGAITNTYIMGPRGIEVYGNTVYVANAGSSSKRVVKIDATTHTVTGNFVTGSGGAGIPCDVQLFNPAGTQELLIDDYSPAHDIDRFSLAGTFIATFHDSTGSGDIASPLQLGVTQAGTVLAAGSVSPRGVYEYDRFGSKINYWANSYTVRGVYELNNTNILFTDDHGVHIIDRATGGITDVVTGASCNYIEYFVPEPAALTLTALAGVLFLRRR
jgi:DNA-binding beta-propeller fold protein YncE